MRLFLPGPQLTLRTDTAGLTGDDLEGEVESMGPRGQRSPQDPHGPGQPGRAHPAARPKPSPRTRSGIATATHRVGEPLTVTVYPRIAFLRSCVLHPELGLRQDWAGSKGLPTPGASEFRGIRPHQPGEPLSHIDWKSTAKTGILMLREMEEPAGADITLLLDGTADQVVGQPARHQLRAGGAGRGQHRRLRPARGARRQPHLPRERPAPGPADRRRRGPPRLCCETLAETSPDATAPLALVLRRLLSERPSPLRSQSLTLVGMTLDPQMARALVSLREDGVNLASSTCRGSRSPGRSAAAAVPAASCRGAGGGGRGTAAAPARAGGAPTRRAGRAPGRGPRSAAVALARRHPLPDPRPRRRPGAQPVRLADRRPSRARRRLAARR